MISTVTISTVTIAMSRDLSGILALIGIILLVVLLVEKEFASAAGSRFQTLIKALNIGIVPLFVTFALIVASKVIEVIR